MDQAARVACARAPSLLQQGRAATAESWLAAIPREIRRRSPWLLYWYGRARSTVDPGGARRPLLRAFSMFRAQATAAGTFLAWAAVAQTFLWEVDDLRPLDRGFEVLEDLRRRFPGFSDPAVEPQLVGAAFGALHHRQPGHPALRHWERRALAVALSAGDPQPRMETARALLQFYAVTVADFDRARLIGDALLPLWASGLVDPATGICWHMTLGCMHLYRGELDAALSAGEESLRLSRESGLRAWDAFVFGCLCLASAAKGDLAAAERALPKMAAAAAHGPKLGRSLYHFVASVLARRRGDLRLAREHGGSALDLAAATGMAMPEADCTLVQALTEPDESALPALERAVERGRRTGTQLVEATALVAIALWRLRRGEEAMALAPVREGLALARECGIRHFVHVTPEELADACALALAHGIRDGLREDPHSHREAGARFARPGARGVAVGYPD